VTRRKLAALAVYLPLFYLFTAAFAAFWTLVLLRLAREHLGECPPSAYMITPEPYFAVWSLPGLETGAMCGSTALDLLLAAVLGRRYFSADWQSGILGPPWDQRQMMRGRRVVAVLCVVLLAPLLVYQTLFMDWYARFDEERIAFNDLFTFGETVYPYSAVDKVVEVSDDRTPTGEAVPHKRLYLFFHDGRRWCDEDYGTRSPEYRTDDDRFLAFVCARSGRPLTRVRFLEDATAP
jgi:hypothetical protein